MYVQALHLLDINSHPYGNTERGGGGVLLFGRAILAT